MGHSILCFPLSERLNQLLESRETDLFKKKKKHEVINEAWAKVSLMVILLILSISDPGTVGPRGTNWSSIIYPLSTFKFKFVSYVWFCLYLHPHVQFKSSREPMLSVLYILYNSSSSQVAKK